MSSKSISKQLILAIDTSCDETSAAVTDGLRVLSNVIASQTEIHKKWGGVVPDIARRAHQEKISGVVSEAIVRAGRALKRQLAIADVGAIAVTYGPGLAIALEVGINYATELAAKYDKKLIAVNHMEGHLLSALAQNSAGKSTLTLQKLQFPALGVLVSGKHTELVLVRAIGEYEVIADTLDDAIGEAYDKVARLLGLGYPGGAVLAEMAKKGNADHKFTIPLKGDPRLAFSYSGLKTAVYYQVKTHTSDLGAQQICDYAASFEQAAIEHLLDKLNKAMQKYSPKTIIAGGGVAANALVRSKIRATAGKYNVKAYFPSNSRLYMDNAAMIGVAAHFSFKKGKFTIEKIDRVPRAKLGQS